MVKINFSKGLFGKIFSIIIVIVIITLICRNNINYVDKQYSSTQVILEKNRLLFDSIVKALIADSMFYQIRLYDTFSNSSRYLIKYCDSSFLFNINNNIKAHIGYFNNNGINDSLLLKSIFLEFDKIFDLVKSTNLYGINNGQSSHFIDFMLEENTSLLYMESKTIFSPGKGDKFVFRHLKDNYYFYYHPSSGFF